MSNKVLLRIAVILGVALLAWGLLALLRRNATDSTVSLRLPQLTADSVDAIEYLGPRDTIRLGKQGSSWTVNGHTAAPRVIEAFFRAMADSSARSEMVAQSAESHSRLGVDSVAGKHLTVKGGGKTLLDVWFGNRGPDFEGFYVRRAGEDPVYLMRGTFADLTVQPLEDWRDRLALSLGTDSITRVEVIRGKSSYGLTRSAGGWTFAKGGAADSTRVTRWLAQFKELRATSFPKPGQTDSASFTPAERKVTLYGSGPQPIAVVSLDSLPSTFILKINEGTERYTLDQKVTDLVVPAESTLKAGK